MYRGRILTIINRLQTKLPITSLKLKEEAKYKLERLKIIFMSLKGKTKYQRCCDTSMSIKSTKIFFLGGGGKGDDWNIL